jgi:hypothetical protein
VGELTDARTSMFIRMIEAEAHAQCYTPRPDDKNLLRQDECIYCGRMLRYSPIHRSMACEYCHPLACRQCGAPMKVEYQFDGKFTLACEKCKREIRCFSTAEPMRRPERMQA